MRLILGLILAAVALGSYYFTTQENPLTGEAQRVSLSVDQEIALGLNAAPEMAQQFGGVSTNARGVRVVDQVGQRLLAVMPDVLPGGDNNPYQFTFTLLDDDNTVNAFALPGGPTFITDALYNQMDNEAQLAGVMGHEMGHVIERHGAQRMRQQELQQGLAQAAVVAAGDPSGADITQMVGQFIQMSYGRDQELESDTYGLELMVAAGYDPRAMVDVMQILAEASGGSGGRPEWSSTHPAPENRIGQIEAWIAQEFPDGVPADLGTPPLR
jgi:predicted Zn-dependent protease